MSTILPERKVVYALTFIIFAQGIFVVLGLLDGPGKFSIFLGFAPGRWGTVLAWAVAAAVAAAFVVNAMSIPHVRTHLLRPGLLKGLSLAAALAAGIVEEVVFRKWIMDALLAHGYGPFIQVFVSGIAFGLAHIFWAFGNVAAGVNAMVSTTLLGFGLAVVYLLGERSLAPSVAAHCLITALIEPGLAIAAARDRLGFWHPKG